MKFVLLGANIDVTETAGRIELAADRAADYVPDEMGTELNFGAMSDAVAGFRMRGLVPSECLDNIRANMKQRGKRK